MGLSIVKDGQPLFYFQKCFLTLWCRGLFWLSADIFFDESVFAFILARESDSFQWNEDNDSTHFLCSYVAMHSLCIHPILFKCGVLYRLFVSGFVRAFLQINGSQLHTFCMILIRIGSCCGRMCYYVLQGYLAEQPRQYDAKAD